MKGILVAGYWMLVKTVTSVTASVQYPESRIKDQFEIDRDDEKISRETVGELKRRP